MPSPHRAVRTLFLLFILPAVLAAQSGKAGLAISANGATETEIFRGWPLLIEVSAFLEDGDRTQLQWPTPLHLTIRDANAAITWPLQLIANPDGAVTVAADSTASALWLLSADATSSMKAADYTLQADHPDAGVSRLILLKVSDEPAALSPAQASLKSRLQSRYEELTGTRETALKILTDALAAAPDDVSILSQQADLLSDMEQFSQALAAANAALRAFSDQYKDAAHPPFELLRRIRVLLDRVTQP